MLSHFSSDMSHDLVTVIEFHPKLSIRQGLRHFALSHERIIFGHKFAPIKTKAPNHQCNLL